MYRSESDASSDAMLLTDPRTSFYPEKKCRKVEARSSCFPSRRRTKPLAYIKAKYPEEGAISAVGTAVMERTSDPLSWNMWALLQFC